MSPHRMTVAPQIIDEAVHWFVLMRESSVTAEDREAFAKWLCTSPVHVGAYLEITRLWGDAAHVSADLPVDLQVDSQPNVVELHAGSAGAAVQTPSGPSGVARQRRKSRFLALAASILLGALVGWGAWWYVSQLPTIYSADIGEQRVITLEDGSTVRLNSRSKLEVRMSPELRQIALVEGQAFFDVAHDPGRPFVVRSGGIAIRAFGTEFDVNQRRSGTVVTVIEGRVRVRTIPPSALSRIFPLSVLKEELNDASQQAGGTAEHPADESPAGGRGAGAASDAHAPRSGTASVERHTVFLSAGEQVKIAGSGAIQAPTKANTAAAISWLQQELVFEGQPLSDVIDEFNRYTRTPIVLSDPSLGELRINAIFHTTNPDSLLRFVSRLEGVRVERTKEEIRILKR